MKEEKRGADTVTLKIPRPLYDNLQTIIQGTGFRSVTEFAIYVLRDLASTGRFEEAGLKAPGPAVRSKTARASGNAASSASAAAVAGTSPEAEHRPDADAPDLETEPGEALDRLTPEEVELVRRRLRSLGYL